MKLTDIEFIKLLPQFMRDDKANQGLAAAIDEIVPQIARSIELLSTWDHIDELSEAELDELAWELNILWYDHGANIDVKRELVKNSDKVYRHLGTKWAVENVINSYFGEGHVEEWFEYGGEPGHFRVSSPNPSLNAEGFDAFINLLNKVKRASAKFDGVFISLAGQMTLAAGMAYHETGHDTFVIGGSV